MTTEPTLSKPSPVLRLRFIVGKFIVGLRAVSKVLRSHESWEVFSLDFSGCLSNTNLVSILIIAVSYFPFPGRIEYKGL